MTTNPSAAPSFSALRFRKAAPPPLARFESGAGVLRGRLHVVGGHLGGDLDVVTSAHYAYHPGRDVWHRCADQPDAVTHFTPQTQADRYLWYAGGYAGKHPGHAVADTRRYDAQDDCWESFAPLPGLRASLGCAIFGERLHVWGGLGADRNTNHGDHWALDLSDPNRWEPRAPMPRARAHFGTGVLGGRAYAIGGHFFHDTPDAARGQTCGDLDDVHVYDPERDLWKPAALLPTRRSHVETATLTHAGKIYILGGRNNSPDALSTDRQSLRRNLPIRVARKLRRRLIGPPAHAGVDHITAYDPGADRWRSVGTLPCPLYACTGGIVDNRLVICGGGTRGWTEPNDQTYVADL